MESNTLRAITPLNGGVLGWGTFCLGCLALSLGTLQNVLDASAILVMATALTCAGLMFYSWQFEVHSEPNERRNRIIIAIGLFFVISASVSLEFAVVIPELIRPLGAGFAAVPFVVFLVGVALLAAGIARSDVCVSRDQVILVIGLSTLVVALGDQRIFSFLNSVVPDLASGFILKIRILAFIAVASFIFIDIGRRTYTYVVPLFEAIRAESKNDVDTLRSLKKGEFITVILRALKMLEIQAHAFLKYSLALLVGIASAARQCIMRTLFSPILWASIALSIAMITSMFLIYYVQTAIIDLNGYMFGTTSGYSAQIFMLLVTITGFVIGIGYRLLVSSQVSEYFFEDSVHVITYISFWVSIISFLLTLVLFIVSYIGIAGLRISSPSCLSVIYVVPAVVLSLVIVRFLKRRLHHQNSVAN